MMPYDNKSEIPRNFFVRDFDIAVDYESDINFIRPNMSSLTILTCEDESIRSPNPFSKRGASSH